MRFRIRNTVTDSARHQHFTPLMFRSRIAVVATLHHHPPRSFAR